MDLNRAMTNLYEQKTLNKQRRQDPTLINLIDCPKTNTTFDQLHGLDSAREEILQIIRGFQKKFEAPDNFNLPILVCGSRRLGKTSLVEAASNHSKMKLIKIPIVTMLTSYNSRNEFRENLEHLIRHSIASQPAIVLVDDLDQIFDKEDYRYIICNAIEKLIAQKLVVFCTIASAANSLNGIQFLSTIQLKRPSLESRFKIIESLCDKLKVFESFTKKDLHKLALNTPSFRAIDLRVMLDLAMIKSEFAPDMKYCEDAIEKVKQSFETGTSLVGERPSVTWSDIGGMSTVREAFCKILKQIKNGGQDCKFAGIALHGPPGCGKTMVAQAMANEAGFNFISIKPAELVNKFLGETEKNIRRVFREAREYEPCIIYFDEFDGLCGTRGNKDSVTSAIQTLLNEMDGFAKRGQSIILVSTNRLDDIDPGILRPGRLTKHIEVKPPNEEARKDILGVILKKRQQVSLANDVHLDEWAKKTDKFTGADLHFLFDEALAKAENDSMDDKIILKHEHFREAIKEILKTNKGLRKRVRSDKNAIERDKPKRLKLN